MRDFKAGRNLYVEGDLTINDSSTQLKLLSVCTNEELFNQRIHRKQLLGQEREAKWKRLATVWLLAAIVLGVAALGFYAQGKTDLAGLVLGFGGLMVGFASVKVFEHPSPFEARQIAALNEIKMILRERQAER
jgi:hypothetical protein